MIEWPTIVDVCWWSFVSAPVDAFRELAREICGFYYEYTMCPSNCDLYIIACECARFKGCTHVISSWRRQCETIFILPPCINVYVCLNCVLRFWYVCFSCYGFLLYNGWLSTSDNVWIFSRGALQSTMNLVISDEPATLNLSACADHLARPDQRQTARGRRSDAIWICFNLQTRYT